MTNFGRAGLGLRALKGGAVVIGLAVEGAQPRVLISTFLATSAQGDRLSAEPYRCAEEIVRGAQGGALEAAAAVAQGRARQDRLARTGLQKIVVELEKARYKAVVAALIVNRAGWITDLLDYSLSWPEHVPVAETLAVRDAIRFALKACRFEVAEFDEKSLPAVAQDVLGLSAAQIDARLQDLGAAAGRPWRKEQKLACLSGWVAMSAG